jgi:thioredoxin
MSDSTQAVTMANFDAVIEENQMVILDFWAAWCGPCKTLAPVFEELAKHNPDIYFGKVNTEEAVDLAQAFQVRSIPTIMAFKGGELMFEQAGMLPPQGFMNLLEQIRNHQPGSAEEMPEELPE